MHTAVESEKLVEVRYPFLIEKLKSEIQRIAGNVRIRIKFVTDPYDAVKIEGTRVSVRKTESKILTFINSNITRHAFILID